MVWKCIDLKVSCFNELKYNHNMTEQFFCKKIKWMAILAENEWGIL